jgi:hypothetical protein
MIAPDLRQPDMLQPLLELGDVGIPDRAERVCFAVLKLAVADDGQRGGQHRRAEHFVVGKASFDQGHVAQNRQNIGDVRHEATAIVRDHVFDVSERYRRRALATPGVEIDRLGAHRGPPISRARGDFKTSAKAPVRVGSRAPFRSMANDRTSPNAHRAMDAAKFGVRPNRRATWAA